MEKAFNNADEFAAFIEAHPELTNIFPWLRELVMLTKNLNKGCGCQKARRVSMRDEVFKNMVVSIIGGNENCSNYLKNYMQASKLTFKIGEEIIKEF